MKQQSPSRGTLGAVPGVCGGTSAFRHGKSSRAGSTDGPSKQGRSCSFLGFADAGLGRGGCAGIGIRSKYCHNDMMKSSLCQPAIPPHDRSDEGWMIGRPSFFVPARLMVAISKSDPFEQPPRFGLCKNGSTLRKVKLLLMQINKVAVSNGYNRPSLCNGRRGMEHRAKQKGGRDLRRGLKQRTVLQNAPVASF